MEDSLEPFLSYFPILFFALGFIGNVLVIRIVHKTQQMHTPTNYLLANMAVSDVITILLISCKKFSENQLGRVSHKFAMSFSFCCFYVTILLRINWDARVINSLHSLARHLALLEFVLRFLLLHSQFSL